MASGAVECREKLILRVRVDLGPGRAEVIPVRHGDDPDALALEFCNNNGVPIEIAPRLGDEIRAQLRRLEVKNQNRDKNQNRQLKQHDGQEHGLYQEGLQDGAQQQAHKTYLTKKTQGNYREPESPPSSSTSASSETPGTIQCRGGSSSSPCNFQLLRGESATKDVRYVDGNNGFNIKGQQEGLRSPTSADTEDTATLPPPPSPKALRTMRTKETEGEDDQEELAEVVPDNDNSGLTSPEARRRAYYGKLQQHYNAKMQQKQIQENKKGGRSGGHNVKSKRKTDDARRRKNIVLSKEAAEATCQRLYDKGLKNKARRERELEIALEEKHREELRGCTFRPEITTFAQTLHGGRTRGSGLDEEIQKFHEAKIVRAHLRQVRDEQEVEELCSFHPRINRRSEALAAEARRRAEHELRRASLHEDLYNEAALRQAERYRLEKKPLFDFKPDTALTHSTFSRDETAEEFIQRIAAPRAENEEELEHAQNVDLTTGRELFKPHVGRGPKGPWARPANVPISDYLFYSRHQFRDVRDQLRQEEDEAAREIQERGTMSKASRRIAQQIRVNRFNLLWKSLRDDTLLAPSAMGAPVPSADEIEERRLRVLVELLPELLLRHIGPDPILDAAASDQNEFVSFLMRSSKGIPCTSDLLIS
mmetsp:Transcript_17783/g.35127  ORF Transcript_17783/g.35127 Transcript_17783/m.35127 type:complete len:650 (+) Transcript_17783:88-2037(+)